MYFVYLLQSINFISQKYVGYITDIEARFKEHNTGKSAHTVKYIF